MVRPLAVTIALFVAVQALACMAAQPTATPTATFSSVSSPTPTPTGTLAVTPPPAPTPGSLEFEFVDEWGSLGDRAGQFVHPSGIAIDSMGRIYLADTENNRVQVFRQVPLR